MKTNVRHPVFQVFAPVPPKAQSPVKSSAKSARRFSALLLGSFLALAGCTKDIDPRGNLPTADALAQLSIGEQTRQDVQGLLGTPATTAVFDDETWYYISSNTTQYAFYKTHELDRQVFVVSFNDRGILKDVRKYEMKDGHMVSAVGRETPTKGREYSILEQLLGNIGRFAGPRRAPGPQ